MKKIILLMTTFSLRPVLFLSLTLLSAVPSANAVSLLCTAHDSHFVQSIGWQTVVELLPSTDDSGALIYKGSNIFKFPDTSLTYLFNVSIPVKAGPELGDLSYIAKYVKSGSIRETRTGISKSAYGGDTGGDTTWYECKNKVGIKKTLYTPHPDFSFHGEGNLGGISCHVNELVGPGLCVE